MNNQIGILVCMAIAAAVAVHILWWGSWFLALRSMFRRPNIRAALAIAVLCTVAIAARAGKPDSLQQIVARRAEMAKTSKVAKSELKAGVVTVTYEDGKVETRPLKRVTMDSRTVGGVDVSLARQRLERAAYAAAKLSSDAPAEAKVAVLDALAQECGKNNKLGQTLAAAAVAALAGIAAGRKTQQKAGQA